MIRAEHEASWPDGSGNVRILICLNSLQRKVRVGKHSVLSATYSRDITHRAKELLIKHDLCKKKKHQNS